LITSNGFANAKTFANVNMMFYEENISKLQNIFAFLQNAALSCLCC